MTLALSPTARLVLTSGFIALFSSTTASADVLSALSAGVDCAKAGVEGAVTITADMAQKAAAASEAAAKAGACTAVQGGNAAPFAVTLGALSAIKIASPESLPNKQCFSSVKKHLARPLAEGLSLAIPVDSVKSTLTKLVQSDLAADALWETLNSTAVLTPYTFQVDCACTTIDAGMTLADFSAISGAVQKASKSCGKFLDEAGLGFINDFGGAAIDGVIQFGEDTYDEASGAWDKHVLGQSKHAGPEEVYGFYFGRWEYPVAVEYALNPGYTFNKKFGNYDLSVDQLWSTCVTYYDDHTMSEDNAKKTCNQHRDRFTNVVVPAGKKLFEYGELPGYYFNTVKFLVDKEWRQRLPKRLNGVMIDPKAWPSATQFRDWTKTEGESLFQDVYGSLGAKGPGDDKWEYPNATGGLRAAREALSTTALDKEQATMTAFSGLKPRLSQTVLEQWNQNRETVTSYFLDTMLPAAVMSARYGCPSAPFEEPCISRLRSRFQGEEICFPEISRRSAELPTLGHVALGVGLAVGGCKSKLAMTVARAQDLGTYTLINPAADMEKYCASTSGRDQRAACGNDLREAADACLIEGIAKGQGDEKILACYAGKGKKVAAIWMSETLKPGQTPMVNGNPAGQGKIKLKLKNDANADPLPDTGQPATDDAEQSPRLKARNVNPERNAAGTSTRRTATVEEDSNAPTDTEAPAPRTLRPLSPALKAAAEAIARSQREQARRTGTAEQAPAENEASSEDEEPPARQTDGQPRILLRRAPILIVPQQ